MFYISTAARFHHVILSLRFYSIFRVLLKNNISCFAILFLNNTRLLTLSTGTPNLEWNLFICFLLAYMITRNK